MFKVIVKWLLTVVAIAAVGYGIFWLARVGFRHWTATLFLAYSAGAVLMLILAAYARYKIRHGDNLDDRLFSIQANIARKQAGAWTRARMSCAGVMFTICSACAWPAMMIVGARRSIAAKGGLNFRTSVHLHQLHADDLTGQPLFMALCLPFGVLTLFLSKQQDRYALWFCVVEIVYVAALCVGATVAPNSLAERLRRSSGSPYKRALMLAGLTTAILVAAYSIIAGRGVLSLDVIEGVVRGLYSQLDSVKQVISGKSVPVLNVAQGVSGALLATAVGSGLLSLGDYKRTDEDVAAIAHAKLALGKAAEALEALRGVTNPSAASMLIESLALIGVNQIDRALNTWHRRFDIAKLPMATDDELKARQLVQLATLYPLSSEALVALMTRWLEFNPPEKVLIGSFGTLVGLGRMTPRDVLSLCAGADGTPRFPILAAQFHLRERELGPAIELTANQVPAESTLDFVNSSTWLFASIMDPKTSAAEDRKTFDDWCKANLKRLTEHVERMNTSEDLFMAIGVVDQLREIAKQNESGHREAIRFLSGSLVHRLKSLPQDKEVSSEILRNIVTPELAEPRL